MILHTPCHPSVLLYNPSPPPIRKNKYTLSLQKKWLQGVLKLALAALAPPPPTTTFTTSTCIHPTHLPALQHCTASPSSVELSLCSVRFLRSVKVISNLCFYLFLQTTLAFPLIRATPQLSHRVLRFPRIKQPSGHIARPCFFPSPRLILPRTIKIRITLPGWLFSECDQR